MGRLCRMGGASWPLGILLLAWISWTAQPSLAQPQPPSEFVVGQEPSIAQIDGWIQNLESNSYATRQLAFRLLQAHPTQSIARVEQWGTSVDDDAAMRLVRLLSGWSNNPDEGHGKLAYEALQRLAKGGVSVRSNLARRSIESIAALQSERSTQYLRRLSVFIDYDAIPLFAFSRVNESHYVLRLNDTYRGTLDDLNCLHWLEDVEVVQLDGRRFDGAYLEKVVKLPNLRILQIRRTSIKSPDVRLLAQLDHLDGLEIMYTPIDDDAIEELGNLSLWGRLRLFGTQMSEEGVARLKMMLDDSEITFGRGGFLGIGSNDMGLTLSMVNPDSGAAKAGLLVGDRILSIQGKTPKNFEELRSELAKYEPGDVVEIEYERVERWRMDDGSLKEDKQVKKVPVVLGEQP